jgi:hypothetical protein
MRTGAGASWAGSEGSAERKARCGRVCAQRCDPEAKSLLVLHDAVNDADDDAWGEKHGVSSARAKRDKHHCASGTASKTHLARTREAAHARARMCSEPPQRIRRH